MSTTVSRNAPPTMTGAPSAVSGVIDEILLTCGILAALLYIGSDILAALRWESYSYLNQSVSELRAIGAPTRPFLLPILAIYSLLEIAFGLGVWRAAGGRRSRRIAGALLIALGILDLSAMFFPMHLRAELQATGRTLTDTMHIVLTGVTVLLIVLIIGFGATANGKWFRIYSYVTIFVLIVMGVWSGFSSEGIEANLPTPWFGVKERINIYGYMLWMAALAFTLFRAHRRKASWGSRS